MAMLKEYFDYYNEYNKKYSNLVILIQVGSFYEMYATKKQGYPLQKIADICNVMLTKKRSRNDKPVDELPDMLGFPLCSTYKFLKILNDNNYTIMLIDQEENKKNTKRYIKDIISPGTFIDNVQTDTNYILSIYIEEEKQLHSVNNLICIGLTLIDITLGSSIIHEIISNNNDSKIAIDQTLKFINSYNPREIIVYFNKQSYSKLDKNLIISYFELYNKIYQYYEEIDKNMLKVSYQIELLNTVFKKKNNMLNIIEYLELDKYVYARISLVLILDYIYKLNANLINNIKYPEDYQHKSYLNLGNNSIYHLNVCNNNNSNKSLFDIINCMSTALGRRYLKQELTFPKIDSEIITKRYKLIESIIRTKSVDILQKILNDVCDIERLHRKMSLRLLLPSEFFNLHTNYLRITELFKTIKKLKLNFDIIDITEYINDYSQYFEFNVNNNNNYFKKHKFKEIDTLQEQIDILKIELNNITNKINTIVDGNYDHFNDKKQTSVKLEYNDRDYHYISLSRKKADEFKKKNTTYENVYYNHNKSYTKITFPKLSEKSHKLVKLEKLMENKLNDTFLVITDELYNKYNIIQNNLSSIISFIDFIVCGAKIAIKYSYHMPQIKNSDKSFFSAKNLRHPIIEQINKDTKYYPHDITLGLDNYGILLYGVNSAGKSSLMKSIGLNIILAQIGYYVAATEFIYNPYLNLFSRIGNNDNIYKNQSSFTLEMYELQSILKRSGQHTLVLADELASSTEVKSGNIIILTMIEMLLKSKTNFISATHFHEIYNYSRFKQFNKIKINHISVEYDTQNDKLIYSRKLLEGPGSTSYGLVIAKFIIHDPEFNKITSEIQSEIYQDNHLVNVKHSKYNSNLYVTKCTVCGLIPKQNETPLETHHIKEQHLANNNNIIDDFHKNNKHNLVVLCSKCHDAIDKKLVVTGYNYTSNGIELVYK